MSELTDLKITKDTEYNRSQSWEEWKDTSNHTMGNFGQSDTPGLSAGDMQKVMDQLPRYVASVLNAVIDALASTAEGASGADQIGAHPLTEGGPSTVQGILEQLATGGGGSAHVSSGTTQPTGGSDGDVYVQFASST